MAVRPIPCSRWTPERTLTGLQERIQTLVRRVCGIGLGNQWSPPGVFTACMAIAACKCPRSIPSPPICKTTSAKLRNGIMSNKLPMPDAVGDHFPAKRDQEFMLGILKATERDHARPTEAIQLMCR